MWIFKRAEGANRVKPLDVEGFMQKLFSLVITVFLLVSPSAQATILSGNFDENKIVSSNFDIALQKELLEMQEKDQTMRTIAIKEIHNPSNELWASIFEIDTKHNQRLREIISQYGWPGISRIGLEGAQAMWLLVQHQDNDLDFQKECLALLKNAVEANEAPFQHYAYLMDRVNKNENVPQIYGTQWIQEDGKFVLYSVEDITHLDARRLAANLSSIAEYKEKIKEAYHLTDEDFK